MRRQFVNPSSFFEPTGGASVLDPFFQHRRPTVLVGIQRDVTPPFFFNGGRLQRMRVIVVAPDQTDNLVDLDGNGADDEGMAEVLPPLATPLAPAQRFRLQPRLIQGEILRGEDGALYERSGLRIRPLRRLVSGSSGEILEVAESAETHPFPRRHGVQIEHENRSDETESPDLEVESEVAPKGRPLETPRRDAPSFRPLFPEPGQWRVVRLGDFKAALASQLAHAERLRDTHRLPCYVQVYEAMTPLRLEELAAAVAGGSASTPRFEPLTQAIALRLQLARLSPPPAGVRHAARREPGFLLPGDRVFRLEIAMDPTVDESDPAPPAENIRAAAAASSQSQPSVPQAPSQPASATIPALKTSISEAFLKPWELRLSREEALYDLSAASAFPGILRRTIGRLFGFRRELRKWQVLLAGRNLEEQLWAVRPPRGGIRHTFIREWARRTLELAGYDTRIMLTEWEIFWTRKGV